MKSETNILSSSSGFEGCKEQWSKGEKQPLVPKAKLDLLPWVGMEEVTVPQRAVCPAPITRDAKLRDAGSLSAPC